MRNIEERNRGETEEQREREGERRRREKGREINGEKDAEGERERDRRREGERGTCEEERSTATATIFFLSDPERREERGERYRSLSLPLYVRGFTGAESTRVGSDSAPALRLRRPSRFVCRRVGYDSAESSIAVLHPELKAICEEFSDIIKGVPGLPPKRTHDHHIHFLTGSEPINLIPHRHPWEQKNTIEKMVQEMLEGGIIRNSQSSYASPVVLVKKVDGTWRLCVDYKSLNQRTIKDKYPIPLIGESSYKALFFFLN